MTTQADADVHWAVSRAQHAGEYLRSLTGDELILRLAGAASLLSDGQSDLSLRALRELPGIARLSHAMVRWGLQHGVGCVTEASLRRLLSECDRSAFGWRLAPHSLSALILAGNVFTASVRPIIGSLLLRTPVVAKASSRGDVMPTLMHSALELIDAELAKALSILTFEGNDSARLSRLLREADVVSVFGGDTTVTAVRQHAPATALLIPHGHGLSAVYIKHLHPKDLAATARKVALDVAAYDQRGCLSPHFIFVDDSAGVSPMAFAEALADEGLAHYQTELPRGILTAEAASAQVQWRGVATVRGELLERDGYAVSYEEDESIRLTPGYRNVGVYRCRGEDALVKQLAPLGVHLKCLAVVGEPAHREALAEAFGPRLAPRLCPAGEMQAPPLESPADGLPPLAGLTRYIATE